MQRYRSLDSNPIRFIVDAVGTIQKKNPLEEAYGCGGKWVSDKPKNNRSPF